MSMPEAEGILITGGTGFLGTTIRNSLASKGFAVASLGRSLANDIQCDLSSAIPTLTKRFDIVIHNAGKAHIMPRNEVESQEFFSNNLQATHNLVTGIERSGYFPRAIIFISSIAVYGLTAGFGIDESHPLSACDPYGKSKVEAERVILEWANRHSITPAILRLPLLAGKNPPGNLGSMINAIRRGYYFRISGSRARKSIVLAEDVADVLPKAAAVGGIFNLTDGHHPSFKEIEDLIVNQTGARNPVNISYGIARLLGMCGDVMNLVLPNKAPITSQKVQKIISSLTFDDQKARGELGWNPRSVIDEFVL